MTVAQYNKLSKEEQYEYRIKKLLDDIGYVNENGEKISLITSSEVIFIELNKLGITTNNKTIDEIFDNLEIKSVEVNTSFNKETIEIYDKISFFKKYTTFLALYLVNNDSTQLSEKYKTEINLFLDYLEYCKM
jgi:hypothetical protein